MIKLIGRIAFRARLANDGLWEINNEKSGKNKMLLAVTWNYQEEEDLCLKGIDIFIFKLVVSVKYADVIEKESYNE